MGDVMEGLRKQAAEMGATIVVLELRDGKGDKLHAIGFMTAAEYKDGRMIKLDESEGAGIVIEGLKIVTD